MDGKRSALPEPHIIQIELEDLILAQTALQDERHELVLHLADRATLLREERVLDELLRQRAAAAEILLPAGHVVPDGRGDADRVDADVIVEPPVLDREDRIDHVLRDVLERDVPAFLAPRRHERRDERWVERQLFWPGLLAHDLQVVDRGRFLGLRRPHPEHDADGLALPIAVPRDEHDGVASDREFAWLPGLGSIGVAKLVQPVDELPRRYGLAPADLEGTREHARVDPLHVPLQPRVDHAREDDVVVAEHAQKHHERSRQSDERVELPSPPEELHGALPGGLGGWFGLGGFGGHSCRQIFRLDRSAGLERLKGELVRLYTAKLGLQPPVARAEAPAARARRGVAARERAGVGPREH